MSETTPDETDQQTPPRDSGVECDHCGSAMRRGYTNQCVGCGRFAPDPRYGHSDITDTWYRVTDYDDIGGGQIRAKSKEQVGRDDVPDWFVYVIEKEEGGDE